MKHYSFIEHLIHFSVVDTLGLGDDFKSGQVGGQMKAIIIESAVAKGYLSKINILVHFPTIPTFF